MRTLLTTVWLALSLTACAPIKPDLSPIPSPQNHDFKPSFDALVLQHTHYLRHRFKQGHALAIAYIYNYAAAARRVEREFGIPAEITIAVGMLESRFGGSNIAICSRNHFGIKRGDGWQGAVFVCQRGKEWRAYATVEASYTGFGEFIQQRVPEFIAAPSVEAFAATGYAGGGRKAKEYAALLNKIITRYELRDLFQ
jgi:flagellum-specific peptidoglycan hydrolase FlgJ